MKSTETKISQPMLYILLALAVKDRHGYEIMKQVQLDSLGQIILGPGTLYGAIKRMLADGLIQEVEDILDHDGRERRVYRLTDLGRQSMATELKQYRQAVRLAEKHSLLSIINLNHA